MTRRSLLALLLAAGLGLAACGSSDPTVAGDGEGSPTTVDGGRVDPETGDPSRPDTGPGREEDGVVTGRVVAADRDGPAVEIQEAAIVTGEDATRAAREAGEIGPDEEWDLDFYVEEGSRRWIDLAPDATVAVLDCTQACEHVPSTLEQVLGGSAPYGGAGALWAFSLEDGRAVHVEEVYLP